MIGIDLFSGAGGMSVGAIQAGIDVVLAIEKDKQAFETFKHNHPDALALNCDIRSVHDIPESISALCSKHEVVLFGGPPCQGFSTSNQRTRNRENPDNWLFQEIVRFTKIIEPDWVVIENVKGMIETEQAIFPKMIAQDLKNLGYKTAFWTLAASSFGVPQKRARLFIVGNKYDISMPEPVGDTETVTVRDAIADLPVLRNGASIDVRPYAKPAVHTFARKMRGRKRQVSNNLVTKNADSIIQRYKHVPKGGNWENIPTDLMANYSNPHKCHTGIYRRLHWAAPSCVIANYRKNMLIHPTQNRGLSVREAARLQSFKDSFRFLGSIGSQQQQVGNAVPPLLAEAVFAKIISCHTSNNEDNIHKSAVNGGAV